LLSKTHEEEKNYKGENEGEEGEEEEEEFCK